MALSKRELEDLRPLIDTSVTKFLGFTEPTLVSAAVNCLDRGYDRRKTVGMSVTHIYDNDSLDKLASILDDSQANSFTEKLYGIYDEYKAMAMRAREYQKKRRTEKEEIEDGSRPRKTRRFDEAPPTVIPEPGNPSPGQLTADKIKEMMTNAQKMIQERRAQLNLPEPGPPPTGKAPVLMNDAVEKAKKAAELQARIQSQMSNSGLPALAPVLPGMIPPFISTGKQQTFMPAPLVLDDEGRTIDAQTGQAIEMRQHMPTLKANIRAKRREQFKAVQDKPLEEIHEARFFDGRLGQKPSQRQKKGFRFHDQGKFVQQAQRLRTKAQLEKLQGEIAQAAKKTGIASAAKLATIQPRKDCVEGEIPDVEWWDAVILRTDSYEGVQGDGIKNIQFDGVTHLVEHPIQMKPPAEPTKQVQIPVMLTKRERKKMRRQTRLEGQKEIQEKVRLGLMPPLEPKVRMANLMRVLGTEAVQDPTKVEAHVRAQMAKRLKAHEEANASRKLTKEQRSEKKIKKIKEDTSLGVHVSVYRVRDLHNPSRKFKIETNCNQLFMTGLVVLHKDCNVVVVEGGPKQQKKFRRLILHRIKWNDEQQVVKDEDDDSDEEEKKINSCNLIWEGMVKNRSFGDIKFKMCPTESFAREQFKKHGVEHYWNLAYSGAVLETTGQEM